MERWLWLRRTVALCAIVWIALFGGSGCGSGGGGSSGSGASAPLSLSPLSEFQSSGLVGGPFAPASKQYTLTNQSGEDIQWTSSAPAAWLLLDITSGTLLAGDSIDIVVSIDQNVAAPLAAGTYTTQIQLQDNLANFTFLDAELEVSDPPVVTPDPMTTATRTTGVAPLLVSFDAVDTTTPLWNSGVVQPANGDFSTFHYEWDFGDGTSGNWSYGSGSRNEATGCVAAHVFDQPGTYQVTLRVLTANDLELLYTQDVVVQSFTGTTYYVSSSTGNNGNPGTNPGSPLASFAAGMAKQGPNVRILFKRGDAFATSGSQNITSVGPGIIGTYGNGAKPVITMNPGTSSGGVVVFRNKDWRMSDLSFVGTGVGIDTDWGVHMQNSKMENLLIQRVDVTAFGLGVGWNEAAGSESHNVIGVVDCNIHDNTEYGMYGGAQHLSVMGSRIANVNNQHSLRVWQANKSVIANNYLAGPAGGKHVIKLIGPPHSETNRLKTEYVQINDNEIHGNSSWSVAVGPTDNTKDERLRHIVFERNHCYTGGIDLIIWARNVTVRNNIFDGTGGNTFYTAVEVARRGIEPASDAVLVCNNTVYTGSNTHQQIALSRVQAVVTNTIVEDNLISAPNAGVPVLLVDVTPSAGIANMQVAATDFVNAALGDFRLVATALGIDAAIALKQVREDFARLDRLLQPDLGAHER